MKIPRVVIAATHSGTGKTSFTSALVAALKNRGLRIQTFKVGPDFLDPTYLSLASGRPCFNLDGWMAGRDYVHHLFSDACRDADLAVVEGVMGLFDGASGSSLEGSTAEIAAWLDAPVILLASAKGAGRSFAATVHGFTKFCPQVHVAGTIANFCGSEKHATLLAESILSAPALPEFLGGILSGSLLPLPSRHLGLVSANENQNAAASIDANASTLLSAVSLDAILRIAHTAPDFPPASPELFLAPPTTDSPQKNKTRVALACDEAFSFYYPDTLRALENAGCELLRFSPLHDSCLPENTAAIFLGGGYPEAHAKTLSANIPMANAIRSFAKNGGSIYAECGGFMFLSEGIETRDGFFPMLGLLPAKTEITEKRQALGYAEVTLTRDCLIGKAGSVLRGHEFHYSRLLSQPVGWQTAYEIHYRKSAAPSPEGFTRGNILASYAHLHLPSNPSALQHLVRSFQKL